MLFVLIYAFTQLDLLFIEFELNKRLINSNLTIHDLRAEFLKTYLGYSIGMQDPSIYLFPWGSLRFIGDLWKII